MIYDDSDICEVSLKCLSLLVQLFGGEYADALSVENMVRTNESYDLFVFSFATNILPFNDNFYLTISICSI